VKFRANRRLADPPSRILPRSPVRVGTAHTTKSTRPHPLLARLMRERLREHSRHLEAQHREAGGDSGSDSDDDARDLTGDVAGTSREASPSNDADDESIVDDFDLHEDDEGGAFDSDAGAGRDDVATNRSIRAAAATPEGRRLVDLVRLESMALDDAIASGASPSQRRVNALLRMERRAKAEAERGRGGNPGRRAAGETRSTGSFSASFARRANPDARPAARSSFLDFAGSFFGRTPDSRGTRRAFDDSNAVATRPTPSPAAARISEKDASRLFDRLYSEKKKVLDRDPDETFKPRLSRKTRLMGADVHARENGGLPRVEYLLRKGTRELRERSARTAKLEKMGGVERSVADVDARVIDPSHFFLDTGSGRPTKPGDSYVRAMRLLHDAALAKDKSVCTFKPRVTKASRAIAAQRDAADPSSARRGPLGMYARGLEFMERRKRESAAAEAARIADEEKECTFRPKSPTRVPGFMRVIAAKMRQRRDDKDGALSDPDLAVLEGPAGALVSAARKREGWLSSPTFSLSGWAESLGIKAPLSPTAREPAADGTRTGGGTGFGSATNGSVADDPDGGVVAETVGASVVVRAGAVSFPSAPAEHPARRRAGAHVPIKSKLSHYGFRNEGKRSATDALEDARLVSSAATTAAEAAHAANLESLFGDVADFGEEFDEPSFADPNATNATNFNDAPPKSPLAARLASGSAGYYRDVDDAARGISGISVTRGVRGRLLESVSGAAPTRETAAPLSRDALSKKWRSAEAKRSVAETDYFERLHLERKQLGRLEEAEKAARLTKYDGSSWTNRVTEPRAPALGKKPDMSKVTSLRRPLVSKTTSSRNARGAFGSGGTAAGHSLSNSVGTASVALSAGAEAAAARRRFAQTPSGSNGETKNAGGAPPASPLAARLASGSAGYYRDVHARTRDPFGLASSRQTSPETGGFTRGPPGWSEGGGGFGGAGVAARRAVFKSADVFENFSQENAASGGSGNESDRNFHDDFGEFRSEGEYDSEFE
jgi:hypothetical protein